jgi:tetratricopeptide (TPR) repeat protein
VPEINRDWDLLQRVERQNAFLGAMSPAIRLASNVHAALLEAGDQVIENYRNNSDPRVQDFDWPKAEVCFTHLIEMDRNAGTEGGRASQGKLALCHGYENLEHAEHIAQADFEKAVGLMPRLPDPHLGLARIDVYELKNIGKAMAELHEAQRLGFEPGPREMEEEADGYRFRATAELEQARKSGGNSNRTAEERYLRLAQRDFDRARQLYEPIEGFSNVSGALRQVDDDDRARQEMSDALNKKPKPKPRSTQRSRYATRRTHWQ